MSKKQSNKNQSKQVQEQVQEKSQEKVEMIKMERPCGQVADVHPKAVEEYEAGGYSVSE